MSNAALRHWLHATKPNDLLEGSKLKDDTCNNSYPRILNQGKSFNCTKWVPLEQYYNNALEQSFVYFEGGLYVCIKDHISSEQTKPAIGYKNGEAVSLSPYWGLVFINNSIDFPNISSLKIYDKKQEALKDISGLPSDVALSHIILIINDNKNNGLYYVHVNDGTYELSRLVESSDYVYLKKMISEIQNLIGDEYTIWFEEGPQIGQIPTLENYPAIEWLDEENGYENHDRDLYYSAELGKCWRFKNGDEPQWEEITDHYTTEALIKINEVDSKFPKEQFLDVEYLVLNYPLVIKNQNVVAGINIPSDKGKIIYCAGYNEENIPYVVYDDGTLLANKCLLSGIIKHPSIYIDNNNFNIVFKEIEGGGYVLNPEYLNSIIFVRELETDIEIYMPYVYNSELNGQSSLSINELRELIGTSFIIYNETIHNIKVHTVLMNSSGNLTYPPTNIEENTLIKLKCELSFSEGKEVVYWDALSGSF